MDAHKDIPADPRLKRLFAYWDGLRGEREMPSRAGIYPTLTYAEAFHPGRTEVL